MSDTLPEPEEKPASRSVVRLRTSMWRDNQGIHLRRSLMFLRRKSKGYQLIEEDIDATNAKEVIPRIVNLVDARDGIYEIVPCGERRDWETGYLEEWSYKLIPFTEGA